MAIIGLIAIMFIINAFAAPSVDFFIARVTPSNGTAVATTAYTFNCTYATNSSGDLSNATLYFSSSAEGAPSANQTTLNVGNDSLVNFTVTGIAEGTYFWACGGTNTSNSKFLNSTSPNNWSITFDTTAPIVTGIIPGSIGTPNNYTGFPITFNVTITEASNISSVFYILNTVVAAGTPGNPGLNDSDTINSSHFMTLALQSETNYSYVSNLSINFSSAFTNPGAHSVYFCANDTANNVRCTSTSLSYIIKGVNISELKSTFSGVGLYPFSINITLENFTADEDGFMAPTVQNYTITFNLTANNFVNIIGMTINESYMRDVSNTQVNNSVTSNIQSAIGNDFDINMSFMNITSFLPEGSLYKYGRFDFLNKLFEKVYRCDGSSADSPGTCTVLNKCNDTVTVDNHSSIIPTNGACFVLNLTSVTGVSSGNTYIFSDTFSGGGGANDTTAPIVTFVNLTNITTFPLTINFTINDTGSGINPTTINLTITDNTIQNNTQLTCSSEVNGTSFITCTKTYNTLPNGTINISVNARDASATRNLVSASKVIDVSVYPTVTLVAPTNNTYFNNQTYLLQHLTFNYTAYFTQINQTNCTLWGNFTNAGFALNQTNASNLVSGNQTNFSALYLGEGIYKWNILCNDSYARSAFSSSNYTFTVDLTAPSATITVSPTTINKDETVTIVCSSSDNLDPNPTAIISVVRPDNTLSPNPGQSYSDTSQTGGTYTAKCTSTDNAGLSTTSTKTFYVNPVNTGGGSSSGSSVSGSTLSTSTNVYSLVNAGVSIESKMSNYESAGIEVIEFTAKENLFNVKIGVNQLNSLPSAITNIPEGVIFKYILVSTSNLPDEKIANATIKFHVDKSWLDGNSLSTEDIVLKRYNNNIWSNLKTEILNEDSARVYYTATTPGLSYFVIASKLNIGGTQTSTEETKTDETVSSETLPKVIPSSEVIVAESPSRTGLWVLLGILLVSSIVVILTVVLPLLKNNKKKRY